MKRRDLTGAYHLNNMRQIKTKVGCHDNMISGCADDWHRQQLASDVQAVHQKTVLQRKIKTTITGKKHKGACFYVTTNCW